MMSLERIQDQIGYLVLNDDGAVIAVSCGFSELKMDKLGFTSMLVSRRRQSNPFCRCQVQSSEH